MNRTAPNILVGVALCLVLAGAYSSEAVAQDLKGRAAGLRREYEQCVVDAVTNQMKLLPKHVDSAMAIEPGLQACSTEERAITALLYSAGVGAIEANQMMADIQLNLKRTIRAVIANPSAYAPPNPASTSPAKGGAGCGYKRHDGAWIKTACQY